MPSPLPPLDSVSVIVPCAGWADTLATCLRSLAAQKVILPVEIVVVVNGPDRGAAPSSWPGATIVHEPVRGPAAARNTGVLASHGDVLAFTDADCVADPGWLAAAVAAMRAGAAGSVIAGAITRSGARRNIVSLYDKVTFLQQEAYVKWSDAFVTANLVVHRSVFERIGVFDLAFNEAAFEDWDWALRARRAGIPIHYEPGAVVDHPCMSRLCEVRAKAERLARGEIVFRRKYRRRVRRPGLLVMVRDHARRAWRNQDLGAPYRLRLAAIGMLAGFWRWRAFQRILRAEQRRRASRLAR